MADSSFDIVSEIDQQEVKNAVAQALKEIQTRYDLKDSKSNIEIGDKELTLTSVDEYKLRAVRDILDRVRRREPPPVSVHDLVRVVRLIDQAYELARGA